LRIADGRGDPPTTPRFLSSATSINCRRSVPGQALADIIRADTIRVVRLTKVFRQAAASRIIVNAHRIDLGLMPELATPVGDSDFYFVPADDPETAAARLLSWRRPASQSASASIQFANSRSCVR
jgi:ATP-dependent exoDNAse (exonuclease V) alpha subunit